MKENFRKLLFRRFVLFSFSAFCLVPVLWLFVSSFKTIEEFPLGYFFPQKEWVFKNYYIAFITRGLWKYYFISIGLTVFCVSISIVFSLITAYALCRMNFPYSKIILSLFLIIMMLPPQLGLVPLYLMFTKLKLIGTPFSLILPYVSGAIPMAVFLLQGNLKSISTEIDDAARIDGAPTLTIVFKILAPVAKPIISATIIISAMGVWNEYLLASTFLNNKWQTLAVAAVRAQQTPSLVPNYPLNMAIVIISFLPLVILFLFTQRYFINGLSDGGVKS